MNDNEKATASPGEQAPPPNTPAARWLSDRNGCATQEWKDGFNTCASYYARATSPESAQERAEGVHGVSCREEWQKRCVEAGFKYWRAPDAHGVECTHEQALALLRDLLGVEVDFAASTEPPTAAEQCTCPKGAHPMFALTDTDCPYHTAKPAAQEAHAVAFRWSGPQDGGWSQWYGIDDNREWYEQALEHASNCGEKIQYAYSPAPSVACMWSDATKPQWFFIADLTDLVLPNDAKTPVYRTRDPITAITDFRARKECEAAMQALDTALASAESLPERRDGEG